MVLAATPDKEPQHLNFFAEPVVQRPLRAQSLETCWVQELLPQSCTYQHQAMLYHR